MDSAKNALKSKTILSGIATIVVAALMIAQENGWLALPEAVAGLLEYVLVATGAGACYGRVKANTVIGKPTGANG